MDSLATHELSWERRALILSIIAYVYLAVQYRGCVCGCVRGVVVDICAGRLVLASGFSLSITL